MEEWYLRIGETDYGPYSLEQMLQYAGEGRINPGHFVRQTTSPDWMEARQAPELAELFISKGEISAVAVKSEHPPAPVAKKPRRKGLLRRPLSLIILILVLAYLGYITVTSLPYIIL